MNHDHSEQITVVRQLGKGGMATVYEAVIGGRRVALKRPRVQEDQIGVRGDVQPFR